MIDKGNVKAGEHYWALYDNQVLVVLVDKDLAFQPAGAWECGIPEKGLTLIEKIEVPESLKGKELYYLFN